MRGLPLPMPAERPRKGAPMRFDATIDSPADVHTVAAMLADEDFIRRKLEASGALDSSHEVIHDGAAFTITTRRGLPTDQVRSEERRVGKEGRCGAWAGRGEKKKGKEQ